MTYGMNYGEVALGVECAWPRNIDLLHRPSHARQFMAWLLAAITQRT